MVYGLLHAMGAYGCLHYQLTFSFTDNAFLTSQVDLGTDGRHCFCKESELLAVVE